MTELKLPRLLAAAKEFNIGQDTLIEFLVKKGFNKEDLKPSAKLSENMYHALQAEFSGDKQAKNRADKIEIPKIIHNERRRRDEEDLSITKKFDKKISNKSNIVSGQSQNAHIDIHEVVDKKLEIAVHDYDENKAILYNQVEDSTIGDNTDVEYEERDSFSHTNENPIGKKDFHEDEYFEKVEDFKIERNLESPETSFVKAQIDDSIDDNQKYTISETKVEQPGFNHGTVPSISSIETNLVENTLKDTTQRDERLISQDNLPLEEPSSLKPIIPNNEIISQPSVQLNDIVEPYTTHTGDEGNEDIKSNEESNLTSSHSQIEKQNTNTKNNTPSQEREMIRIEAPELEGPKLLHKIDLSAIDFSTRPKKAPENRQSNIPKPADVKSVVKHPYPPQTNTISNNDSHKYPQRQAPKQPVQKSNPNLPNNNSFPPHIQRNSTSQNNLPDDVRKAEQKVSPQKFVDVKKHDVLQNNINPNVPKDTLQAQVERKQLETKSLEPKPDTLGLTNNALTTPTIENIEVEKILGPKVVGKITLPTEFDTKPKNLSDKNEERRPRKRIFLDKRVEQPSHFSNRGNAQHSSGGSFHPQQQPQHQQPSNKNAGHGQPFQTNQPQRHPLPHNQPPQQGGFVNKDGRQMRSGGNGLPPQQPQQRIPSTTGNNRPIVPAQPRPGTQQGGGFNRDNNRSGFVQRSGSNTQSSGRIREIRPIDKEIDAKEIQDKIKETQAKLVGIGGRGKSLKAKYRRAKRSDAADSQVGNDTENKLQVTEFVTVSELANLMDVSFAEVIGKCMNLGIMVSINQRLDAEVIELVASEFSFEVEFIGIDDVDVEEEEEEKEDTENMTDRAPIVTIMGHVDHGKTSLLDYVRRANVVAGEAGGITQHIGAYEVLLPDQRSITFLDTPGHEAFTAMRARGAKVTDVAVIVVAADDAVMPQTKEAISHAQAAGVPMIFAVNKIDKDGAKPEKIYEQLASMNILVESWGGKYQSQEISAKKGLNVDLLLEKILLEADLLGLKANHKKDANGTVIEASLDKGRGFVATILVQGGTLKQGDLIVSGQYYGRVKAMFNERNQRATKAGPSTPIVILGLNGAPQAGEKFKVFHNEAEAKEVATKRAQILREQGLRARKHITLDEIGRRLALGNFKELNVIIKGDVDGSVEALSDSLQKLSTSEVAIRVVHKAVGQISESDVLLATASDAIVIGFNVRPSSQANKLAINEGVQIKQYSIIYTAIDEIRSAMEGMLEPKMEEKEVATVEIKEVYKFDKITVAGCYVQEGRIKRDHKIRVYRDGILIYPRQEGGYAELGSLKRYKDDVKEVNNGFECGLTVKGFTDMNVSDTIVAYEEEEVKRTL